MSAEPVSQPVTDPPIPLRPKFLTRPKSEDPKDTGFERRPMVDWLAPGQLTATGIKSVLSGIFGAYADKRDVMAALDPEPAPHVYTDREEIWIDYVADLGDGFDATYSLATLLAAPGLTLGGQATRRGEILIMGGDQVYPTASYDEYHNRLLMPYKAALPCVLEGRPPHLYAVPGNHDWYDGLSNFARIFCQRGWIGGWKTQQKRSYFALKLPHKWWLWGIDIQLEGFIDSAQLDYFKQIEVAPEDRIILCTAEPSWVYAVTKGPEAFRSLSYFEDRIIREKGRARMRVALTGDLHHYTRYESTDDDQTQRITAGGGGAYLYATHEMPEELPLAEGKEQVGDEVKDRTVDYSLKQTFPSRERSRTLALGSLRLPWRSWRFGAFLATFYGFFTWLLQSASLTLDETSFLETARDASLGTTVRELFYTAVRSPEVAFFSLLMIGGMIAFCAAPKTLARILIGGAHGLAHLLLAVLLVWSFAKINPGLPWLAGRHPGTLPYLGTSVVEMLLVGGFLGGFLMAIYLMLCSSLGGFHTNEVFSSQRIPDYKNFLRLHIDRTGRLTIYPVGIPAACKDWRFQKEGEISDPWWTPEKPIQAELIEKPIVVS